MIHRMPSRRTTPHVDAPSSRAVEERKYNTEDLKPRESKPAAEAARLLRHERPVEPKATWRSHRNPVDSAIPSRPA